MRTGALNVNRAAVHVKTVLALKTVPALVVNADGAAVHVNAVFGIDAVLVAGAYGEPAVSAEAQGAVGAQGAVVAGAQSPLGGFNQILVAGIYRGGIVIIEFHAVCGAVPGAEDPAVGKVVIPFKRNKGSGGLGAHHNGRIGAAGNIDAVKSKADYGILLPGKFDGSILRCSGKDNLGNHLIKTGNLQPGKIHGNIAVPIVIQRAVNGGAEEGISVIKPLVINAIQ